MLCPCGCGQTLHMSLLAEDRPRWEVTVHDDGTPSLHPSVWRRWGAAVTSSSAAAAWSGASSEELREDVIPAPPDQGILPADEPTHRYPACPRRVAALLPCPRLVRSFRRLLRPARPFALRPPRRPLFFALSPPLFFIWYNPLPALLNRLSLMRAWLTMPRKLALLDLYPAASTPSMMSPTATGPRDFEST